MNSKAAKKPIKQEPPQKPKLKSKPKPKLKISKPKVQETNRLNPLNKTHRNGDISSTRRNLNSPLNYFSERPSVNYKKHKDLQDDHKLKLNCHIRMKELVTEEDVICLESDSDLEQNDQYYVNQSIDSFEICEHRAAVIIQKMWKGYKTRKLLRGHIQSYKKIKQTEKQDLQKTHKLFHTRKKSNLQQVIDMTQTKHLGDIGLAELLKNGLDGNMSSSDKPMKTELVKNKGGKKMQEQLQKLKKDQAEKWSQIIQLIQYIPTEDIHNNQILRTLIHKSQQNRSQLWNIEHILPIDPSPLKSSPPFNQQVDIPPAPMMIINEHKFTEPLSDRTESSGFQDHPFMKIIELQLKMMKDRLEIQIKKLEKKYNNHKIDEEQYQQKKHQLLKDFQEEEKNVINNKSQISFSLQKAHDAIISSKRDASFLYRATGRETSLRHSISDESVLLNSFIKQKLFIQQELSSCASQQSIKIKRTSTELQCTESPQVIIQELQINLQTDPSRQIILNEQMQSVKQTAEFIQKNIEEQIISELTLQLYLNDKMSNVLLPYYQIQNSYKFRKLTDADIQAFLKVLLTPPFRPTKQDFVKRLNQKINPSARQLLKILRNQEPEQDEDSEFYELVIPEQVFKQFREWKQTSIVTDLLLPPSIKNPINTSDLGTQHSLKINERSQAARERKKKVLKFQKDLQAMYYKAVFNCFNEAIIQVKCSYSPLNGRSTIGPGELRVSLLDANTPVSVKQIESIIQKGKQKVMDNFKYRCPALDSSSYSSLNRFQEALVKQIQYQFNSNEHKWISFFDEYLEIATELTGVITQHLYMEATKEIFKMQLCRI